MDYPNNTEYLKEFSERLRSYLILSGIHNEHTIADILSRFFTSTNLRFSFAEDWKLWQTHLESNHLKVTNSLPLPDRSWQFGSMIPQSADWKRDTQKTKQSIVGSLKPLFIIASIFLWSLLYYIIIFRLL
ncbi:hypothetical protein EHQ68_17660 [Leptospira congkakensis]|uniref:Uncharacterized protein n=2 Tax=Leptospira congkakensis TaxID=2484932 RepID=A0A4Z1A8U2_9LEPT|nr:hypothetical protein [Leptospira congkakensis]TGL85281.1 hypothetical protein EHQ68_17660 [Leptospira congkakensis]TGL85389.1 hypothetical protein EHQ69_18650 [Leptospira congkakensis]TGL99914.1 hypothetical protein EHQ70_00755 [Leptospira congkakensis]